MRSAARATYRKSDFAGTTVPSKGISALAFTIALMSIAKNKVRKRREADLCGACGKNPCECKRPARKQHNDPVPTPDLNRKKSSAITGKGMSVAEFRKWVQNP
jgi:hypothetical protein